MEDLTRIRVHEPDRTGILVELFGEFDVGAKEALRRTVGGVACWGRPIFVDLSGVTFLDSLCLRELAVQQQLHFDDLVLCNPSWQVELSVAACGLEGWIDFRQNEDLGSRATIGEPTRHASNEEERAHQARRRR